MVGKKPFNKLCLKAYRVRMNCSSRFQCVAAHSYSDSTQRTKKMIVRCLDSNLMMCLGLMKMKRHLLWPMLMYDFVSTTMFEELSKVLCHETLEFSVG